MNLKKPGGVFQTPSNRDKKPVFFSLPTFEKMKGSGNTHYCFHCLGSRGFIPGENGVATNCEDEKSFLVSASDKRVTNQDVVNNEFLDSHIIDIPGYRRRHPNHYQYDKWLGYAAYFQYGVEFARWCKENGYEVCRHNPMKNHDPEAHADGIIGGVQRHDLALTWLEGGLSEGFPFIVHAH